MVFKDRRKGVDLLRCPLTLVARLPKGMNKVLSYLILTGPLQYLLVGILLRKRDAHLQIQMK